MASFEARIPSGSTGSEQFTPRVMFHPDFPEDSHKAVAQAYNTPHLAGGGNELALRTSQQIDKDYTKNMIAARLKQSSQQAAQVEPEAPAAQTVPEVAPKSPWHSEDLFEATKAATGITFGEPRPPVEGGSQ